MISLHRFEQQYRPSQGQGDHLVRQRQPVSPLRVLPWEQLSLRRPGFECHGVRT
jgi:hypothetical protein